MKVGNATNQAMYTGLLHSVHNNLIIRACHRPRRICSFCQILLLIEQEYLMESVEIAILYSGHNYIDQRR